MFEAKHAKEIIIQTSNWVGKFKEIVKIIAEKGVDVIAVSCSTHGIVGVVRMVTDDNLRAVEALTAHGFKVREDEAIVIDLPHRPGLLRQMTARLEEANIDVKHLYATSLPDAGRCMVIFDTTNNARALVELNRMVFALP